MFLKLLQNIINSLGVLFFFITYKSKGIVAASAVQGVYCVFLFGFNFFILKKFYISNFITSLIVCVFSSATVLTGNVQYVEFHITVLNCFFVIMLCTGILFKKNFLRYIIGDLLPADGDIWLILSRYWAFLFLFIAALNEVIRHYGSEDVWVYYVVFGISAMTFSFLIFQMSYIKKNLKIL